MWIALGIIAAAILVAVCACLKVSGDESRKEDEHEY